ncbi:hypothetical protein H9Y04_04380 [Streptomyces sp. TRM66268-LWL]|uniref:Uncharacterized protein n=1 Tax=Streptomyces polyasparticus TaxID=2767826 RepID=A0ABR7SAL5_9ACTN|nr:hypothetical protein [Streptomyces polyasparticus]MBC9711805.1 hypothetical protein [Streptomyces polyasparticus]
MSAPAHTSSPQQARGAQARLPWWGVALPVIAFVALFLVVLHPAEAQAATGDPAVGDFLGRLKETLMFRIP